MVKPEMITVLVVDDEADIVELLNDEFSFEGFKTRMAYCGNDAKKIVESEHIDVVVSDYKMPNGNGMDLLTAVMAVPEEKRPLFYFISGQADVTVDQALRAGARRFFHKPFSLSELIDEVKLTLEAKEKAVA